MHTATLKPKRSPLAKRTQAAPVAVAVDNKKISPMSISAQCHFSQPLRSTRIRTRIDCRAGARDEKGGESPSWDVAEFGVTHAVRYGRGYG